MSFTRRSALLTFWVATLLALHFWLGVSATFEKSVTSDETAHLVGGYSYWKFNDYRLQPENGNLPQRWAALPLLLEKPRLEPVDEPYVWSLSHVWLISQRFFFDSGNNTDFMLATARAAMMFWSLATGLLVFFWSRRLWGDWGGVFSLTLYVFSATTLAHGPLVTSDMTIAFWLLAACGAYWRHLEKPSMGTLALSLAATGLAAVSKFSFLLLIPTFGALLVWRLAETAPMAVAFGRNSRVFTSRSERLGLMLASAALHVCIAWGVIWLFFGFRFSAFDPSLPVGLKFYIPWDVVMPEHGFWKFFMTTARNWHLLPEAYLQGFAYVLHAAQQRGAFLNGDYSNTGWVSFFPYAFLVKTPPAELAAFVIAGLATLFRWRTKTIAGVCSDLRRVAPLLILFLVYWGFSLTSHLNIGHRHILPTYPVLFILAGLLIRSESSKKMRTCAAGVSLAAAFTAFAVHPNYLAYFNTLGGGSSQGYRHLVDSSLDWGQDLPSLSRWLRQNQQTGEPAYLSYFGMGDPRYEGIHAAPLAPYYNHYRLRGWFELKPGLYCVSATLLQDVYSNWRGTWTPSHESTYQILLKKMRAELAAHQRTSQIAEFGEGDSKPLWNLDRLRFARLAQYLRLRRPDAIINSSIFVYRLNSREIYAAVEGSPQELADLMDQALNPPPSTR
ncbi:MAG: glycosyltransferase family 39 protein [Opitutaceae bacterium]|jgi:hypothetical protein